MCVQVVGAGSVGLYIAVQLARAGNAVRLVTNTAEQAEQINKNKITLIDNQQIVGCYEVVASGELLFVDAKIVIVTVKYQHLEELYPRLLQYKEDTIFVFLQNGILHYDEIKALPFRRVLFGSAQFGVAKNSHHEVKLNGQGVLKLAKAKGDFSAVYLQAICSSIPLQIELVNDAEMMLFEKAILNSCINPLTTILNVENGKLVENKEAFRMLRNVYDELADEFEVVKKIVPFENVVALCKKTSHNTSSMLMDRRNGRKTEVESIVGGILNRATKELPYLKTLYSLVLALELEGRK